MSIWATSLLCREMDAARELRDAAVRRNFETEHVAIVRAWKSHGMRIRVPRVRGDDEPHVPGQGTLLWRVMILLSSGGASAKNVARGLNFPEQNARHYLCKLQRMRMVKIGECRKGEVYRYKLSAYGQRAVREAEEALRAA